MNIKTEVLGDGLRGEGRIRVDSQNPGLSHWVNRCHLLGWSCPLQEVTFKGKMSTERYLQDSKCKCAVVITGSAQREKPIRVRP